LIATHQASLELSESVPTAVEAGASITLKIKVSCPSACNLRGGSVKVIGTDRVVMTSELARYDGRLNETEAFAFPAPKEVGEYAWSIAFTRHETEDGVHEEVSLPISFRTIPHKTDMAVWDVPSPVAMNSPFKVKAGIKCSAGCKLLGQLVEVHDEIGMKGGEGRLGEQPWPGTSGLCWAEMDLTAPAFEGVSSWLVTFTGAELELPHEDASARFDFRSARSPEHRVTVKITGKDTEAPVEDVEVRLGLYAASTDERGLAKLALPKGIYELDIRKDGYTAEPMTVDVSEDVTVHVVALASQQKDELDPYPEGWWG
jgi:hypothetical protein